MNIRYTKDQLEAVLEYGVDMLGRKVYLHGDVEEDTIGRVIRGMYVLGTVSDKPIELFVSSYGGVVDESMALHDVTRTIGCPVHTIALGKCMSAAPLLVACGEPGHRYATENTVFMLHDSHFDDVEGRPDDLQVLIDLEKASLGAYAKLLARYSKKPPVFWRNIFRRKTDRYFTATEAQEWGMIDHIWEEK